MLNDKTRKKKNIWPFFWKHLNVIISTAALASQKIYDRMSVSQFSISYVFSGVCRNYILFILHINKQLMWTWHKEEEADCAFNLNRTKRHEMSCSLWLSPAWIYIYLGRWAVIWLFIKRYMINHFMKLLSEAIWLTRQSFILLLCRLTSEW